MTATLEMRTAVDNHQQRQREINMYGLTESDLRASVESSITFRTSGPAMVVASWMSDAQEEIEHGMSESARKTLNRAKFVLFEYIMDRANG